MSCLEKYLKKLVGNTDIEDSLHQLDKLTQEEARMASAEQLGIAHSVERRVIGVDERVQGVSDDVQIAGKKVEGADDRFKLHGIDGEVRRIGHKVQGIDDDVKDVGDRVQGVDRKLDDNSRSHLFVRLAFHSEI